MLERAEICDDYTISAMDLPCQFWRMAEPFCDGVVTCASVLKSHKTMIDLESTSDWHRLLAIKTQVSGHFHFPQSSSCKVKARRGGLRLSVVGND